VITKMHNWEVAELVYTIRLLAHNLEQKQDKTEEEEEILTIAYEALLIPPRDIHELANIIENNENFA
jgi:hypothetical protein